VDSTIVTTNEFFGVYEIYHPEEQKLLVRLFKRFFHMTIGRKYGYLKGNVKDLPEVSAVVLCNELDLNVKVLKFFGVFSTFK
jgi:hypothetical protein